MDCVINIKTIKGDKARDRSRNSTNVRVYKFRVKVIKYRVVCMVFTIVDDGVILFTCRFRDIRARATTMKRT